MRSTLITSSTRLARLILLTPVLLALSVGPSVGRTIVVDCDGGGDYLSIQEGINAATAGDTVLVAPCVYYERLTLGPSADGVVLLGDAGPDLTIVDGQGVIGPPLLACVDVGPATRVEGFTFIRGKRSLGSGAGVRCERADVRLTGNVIRDCWASGGWGGGIYAEYSEIEIVGCTISGNRSDDGGGILIMWGSAQIESNIITGNRADGFHGGSTGGGVNLGEGTHVVSGNTIAGNEAAVGGGLIVEWATSVLLEGNTISCNNAWYSGGALVVYGTPIIALSNVVVGNEVGYGGRGGAAIIGGGGDPPSSDPPIFTDNVFFGNAAGSESAIEVVHDGPLPVFQGNHLVDDATYQIVVDDTPSVDTLDFRGNWWGTDDPDAIAERIYDSSDDPSLFWSVDFSDWCTDPSCLGHVTGVDGGRELKKTWSTIKSIYR